MSDGFTMSKQFSATEKGNTMLARDDGATVAWLALDNDLWLEIADTPGNSPRLYVGVIEQSAEKIRQHILRHLGGWQVIRWNLDDNPPEDHRICELFDPEDEDE